MPITQDRLMVLIGICDLHYQRLNQLSNQSLVIRHDLAGAISNGDNELAFTYLDQLMNEISIATRVRESEYRMYMKEKQHFEMNAAHNSKSKALMARNRQRLQGMLGLTNTTDMSVNEEKAYIKQLMTQVDTEQKANVIADIPEKKDIAIALDLYARLDRHYDHNNPAHKPIPAETLAEAIEESEGFVNKIVIPYLMSQGLLIQPDPTIRAYAPKRRMGE
jgi:hypothetical protein